MPIYSGRERVLRSQILNLVTFDPLNPKSLLGQCLNSQVLISGFYCSVVLKLLVIYRIPVLQKSWIIFSIGFCFQNAKGFRGLERHTISANFNSLLRYQEESIEEQKVMRMKNKKIWETGKIQFSGSQKDCNMELLNETDSTHKLLEQGGGCSISPSLHYVLSPVEAFSIIIYGKYQEK